MILLKVIDVPSAEKFNHHVKRGLSFVQFHSPLCGHCKTFAPIWEEFANEFKSECTNNVLVAKIRSDMMGKVKCYKKILGFPTMFVLNKGKKVKEYEGERTKDALLSFARSNLSSVKTSRRRKRSRRRHRSHVRRKSRTSGRKTRKHRGQRGGRRNKRRRR